VQEAHAVVLAGGSAFGLAAASGVQGWLRQRGLGFAVAGHHVPIVPQAILFDLANGGDKRWGATSPYEQLGRIACDAAARNHAIGSVGAGYGATTATLRGGLGSTSQRLHRGLVVGALVAANPLGSATIADSRHFWAAPLERGGEFGGLGLPQPFPPLPAAPRLKGGGPGQSTTIAVVATNARLGKAEAYRLAVMAQTGLARAIHPVHSPLDGDVVFTLATGEIALTDPIRELTLLGAAAADALSRAVARGIYAAAPEPPGWLGPPAWCSLFGDRS
jgi:L-aminopeptidase/D-esterase-like protein